MVRQICKERRGRARELRYRVHNKLSHGMGLLLCSFFLCACSTPAPGDAIDFAPAATAQMELKQKEPAPAISGAESMDVYQAPVETPAPEVSERPVQAEAEQDHTATAAPNNTPEELNPAAQSAASATPLPELVEDAPASAVQNDFFTLQSVVEIGSVMRVQIPRALVKEGISSTAEYVVNITYNSDELLSCVVEVIGLDGGTANALVPLTLDLKTGDSCKLSDFFSKEDTGWKGLIPDLVTDIAKQKELTLLCEVPPVGEDQPFHIEDGKIVLLYRPYEITTYEAGAPAFVLPEKELAPYLSGAYGIGEKG